jgi:dimethylargininase
MVHGLILAGRGARVGELEVLSRDLGQGHEAAHLGRVAQVQEIRVEGHLAPFARILPGTASPGVLACAAMSTQSFELRAPAVALVRSVSRCFDRCLRSGPVAPDPARAAEQHAAYCAALADCGAALVVLAADESAPDACFVEDTAVILGEDIVITRPGAAERRAEVEAIAGALASRGRLHPMTAPARLDGGDVMRVGMRLFVGLTGRSDAAGVEQLAAVAVPLGFEVHAVPLAAGLHLKSAATVVDAHTVVVYAADLDPAPFAAAGLEVIVTQEPAAGNVLALGRRVLISAAAPRLGEQLAARGLEVGVLELSEFHRADGALTCLSLRLPAPGSWCV